MTDHDVIEVNGKVYFAADRVLEILETNLWCRENSPVPDCSPKLFKAGYSGALQNMIVTFRSMRGEAKESD